MIDLPKHTVRLRRYNAETNSYTSMRDVAQPWLIFRSPPCVCDGKWAPGAQRILAVNRIGEHQFCKAACLALELGAKRSVNIACVGGGGGSALRAALPGHNGVMEGAERFRAACERHLEMSASAARTARKAALSRPRATATLALNSRVMSLPESVREWMKS